MKKMIKHRVRIIFLMSMLCGLVINPKKMATPNTSKENLKKNIIKSYKNKNNPRADKSKGKSISTSNPNQPKNTKTIFGSTPFHALSTHQENQSPNQDAPKAENPLKDIRANNPFSVLSTDFTYKDFYLKQYSGNSAEFDSSFFWFREKQSNMDPTVIYLGYCFESTEIVGFKFKRVGKTYQHFIVYRVDKNFGFYIESFNVRFNQFSIFDRDFQLSGFFDQMLLENSKKLATSREELDTFNEAFRKRESFSMNKFVCFKIPRWHWSHPESLENKEQCTERVNRFFGRVDSRTRSDTMRRSEPSQDDGSKATLEVQPNEKHSKSSSNLEAFETKLKGKAWFQILHSKSQSDKKPKAKRKAAKNRRPKRVELSNSILDIVSTMLTPISEQVDAESRSSKPMSTAQRAELKDSDEDGAEESTTRRVGLWRVMDIYNRELDWKYFRKSSLWKVGPRIHAKLVHQGEFVLSDHSVFLCFDEEFKTFMLLSKNSSFVDHSQEFRGFKADFNVFIKSYAKVNLLHEVNFENSFRDISVVSQYRHAADQSVVSALLFYPRFGQVFYMEINLFSCSVVKSVILTTEEQASKSNHFQKVSLHRNKFVSFIFVDSFYLIPLTHFLDHLPNIDWADFDFSLPMDIHDVFVFSANRIGILSRDHTLQKMAEKTFKVDQTVDHLNFFAARIHETKRKSEMSRFVTKFEHELVAGNRSKLAVFSVWFNQVSTQVEKFTFQYTIHLGECFIFQSLAVRRYLKKLQGYIRSIDPEDLSHLQLKPGTYQKLYFDPLEKEREVLRRSLQEYLERVRFFAFDDDFMCLFQNKHFKDPRDQIAYSIYLKGDARANSQIPLRQSLRG